MAVKKLGCIFLVTLCVILTGCSSKASEKVESYISIEEAERLVSENEQLKKNLKEMEELIECINNISQLKNLNGYSMEQLEELQNGFEQLIFNPSYDPESHIPLFYYVCGNTDVIKEIYDNGNITLAERIIDTNMYWSGEFRIIKDFIKAWSTTLTDEDSNWNVMIYKECIKAFETFKYYPEDLQEAKTVLPTEVFQDIMLIHEECEDFPDGITKADFD